MGTGEEKQLGGECGGGARLHHFPVNQAGRRRPHARGWSGAGTRGASAVPRPRRPSPTRGRPAPLHLAAPPCAAVSCAGGGGMEGWVDE